MQAIWDRYLPDTRERLDLLDTAAAELAAGTLDAARVSEARETAHRLAGTVGTFGLDRASGVARHIEALLRTDLGPAEVGEVATLVADLREYLELPVAPPIPDLGAAESRSLPMLLMVAPATGPAERMRLEARRRGLRVVASDTVAEARTRLERDEPEVVLVDAAVDGALGLLDHLRADVPVVVLVGDDAPEARLEAARRGAAICLDVQAPPGHVVDQLAVALQRLLAERDRVLAVGACEDARVELQAAGVPVESAAGSEQLWQDLERVDPALVLLDGDLPDLETLCRALRNDPGWAVKPIVVAGRDLDAERAERLLGAGADDVVTDGLVARVRSRIARQQAYNATTGVDALTGLADRRTSTAALRNLTRMAERLSKPLCVALVEADGSEAGMRRLAAILRRSFREEDVLARWGARHFAVGMFSMERDGGIARLREILNHYRDDPPHREFVAGVAEYPRDGADLEAICTAADESLTAARATAPGHIAGAGRLQDAANFVDVAVVEDDDATAEAMLYALGGRGHRCWRFSNGAGAVAMLAGEEPSLRARVIVLDLNLPAVSGLELLTVLAADGVLRTSRVIVVSVDGEAARVERARELGAQDFLVKPFAIETLADRVDAALGRRA